jgi:Protein of unknown function (DUF2786)
MSAPLYEYKPNRKTETKTREKLIETISKLLAPGRAEGEAASFTEKAKALMAEHGITMAEVEAAR